MSALSPSLRRLLERHSVGGSAWQALGGATGDGLATPVVESEPVSVTGWAILVSEGQVVSLPIPAFVATPGWHFLCDASQAVATGQRLISATDATIVFQIMDVQRQPDGVFCTIKPSV